MAEDKDKKPRKPEGPGEGAGPNSNQHEMSRHKTRRAPNRKHNPTLADYVKAALTAANGGATAIDHHDPKQT